MRVVLFLAFALLISSCSKSIELKTGTWRGTIALPTQILPFTFEVFKENDQYKIFFRNAAEKLLTDEISFYGDSVKIVMHIFDTELRAKVSGNKLNGFYYKNYDTSFKQAFTATLGDDYRFEKTTDQKLTDFAGKYGVTFISSKNDTTVAVGIFTQHGNHVTGTFLTPLGDYRYLEGSVIKDELWLSTFDGNHAYLFSARKIDSLHLQGDYWSGKNSHESWTGIKDDKAALPDADSLTYLKEGYDQITFSFPDLEKNQVSPSDEKYKDKILILQIFGTWCPNCMDETKFLNEWYRQNKSRGVEILALAYERKDDFDYASERIKKMKAKLGVDYDFVIAGSNNDKTKASQTLPMLNRVIAFPTTIFIGRDGKVKHIRTGFEGPGTGVYYDKFRTRFNDVVNELLVEKKPS